MKGTAAVFALGRFGGPEWGFAAIKGPYRLLTMGGGTMVMER
jgi:hypothetical protein